MFTIANQSFINIRSETDLQNAKNRRKFEFRRHGLRISLKAFLGHHLDKGPLKMKMLLILLENYKIRD